MNNRKIICLTPIKNEAWILDTFLQAASLWADHIVIADQGSTDKSREIALSYPKVVLIENKSEKFNEPDRQKQLIDRARDFDGENNIFIALDADEFLIDFNSGEFQSFNLLEPGTTIWMDWINLLPNKKMIYNSSGGKALFGYIDDGAQHSGNKIHSYRLPTKEGGARYECDVVKNLHLQYAFLNRLAAKHRWYQCLERITFPDKSDIDIYRIYHHIDVPVTNTEAIERDYLLKNGLDPENIRDDEYYWWDQEILHFFDQHGIEKFRKTDIWKVDWIKGETKIPDPRSVLDVLVHKWLKKSQSNRFSFSNKVVDKILRLIKW